MTEARTWSRDGYDPEWLALEDAMGGRFVMSGDLEKEVPIFNATFAALAQQWPAIEEHLDIVDETIEAAPYNMQCRIYRPQSFQPLPLMVHFHGGAFVAGTLDTDDPFCRIFAAKTPCVVVSVDYPLAPANKMDQIIDAGVKSVIWARENTARLGASATNTLICGGSAGALLSAMVAHHFTSVLKDYTSIKGCVLLFATGAPYDYGGPYKERFTAWKENGESDVPVFNKRVWDEVTSFWGIDDNSPAHYVLLDPDLSRCPPCYIVSAEKDCLRDDGVVFDLRLRDAGVRSKLDMYKGLPHWFHAFPQLQVAHTMMEKSVGGVRWLLGDEEA